MTNQTSFLQHWAPVQVCLKYRATRMPSEAEPNHAPIMKAPCKRKNTLDFASKFTAIPNGWKKLKIMEKSKNDQKTLPKVPRTHLWRDVSKSVHFWKFLRLKRRHIYPSVIGIDWCWREYCRRWYEYRWVAWIRN